MIVRESHRRRGVGTELTRRRLELLTERTDEVFYFADPDNAASIALHAQLGFVEERRPFVWPRPLSDVVVFRARLERRAGE